MQLIDKQLPMAVTNVCNRKYIDMSTCRSFRPVFLLFQSCISVHPLTAVSAEVFKLTVQAVLLFLAQKWLVVSLPAVLAVVYVVQKIYLRTSRQLRFLELEAKAAVFSSFLEAVSNVTIVALSISPFPLPADSIWHLRLHELTGA
jgi:hypothetical protein